MRFRLGWMRMDDKEKMNGWKEEAAYVFDRHDNGWMRIYGWCEWWRLERFGWDMDGDEVWWCLEWMRVNGVEDGWIGMKNAAVNDLDESLKWTKIIALKCLDEDKRIRRAKR